MRILIPGGSGQVGRRLAEHFLLSGHSVTVLSRNPRPEPWRTVSWDGESPGAATIYRHALDRPMTESDGEMGGKEPGAPATWRSSIDVATAWEAAFFDFMRTILKAWGVPIGLPSFSWMVEIGAFLMQTESELVLKSRRVVPSRLQAAGFEFRYPDRQKAAQDLVSRYSTSRSGSSSPTLGS